MGAIFISYRREDSQGEALHLFDDLKEQFGIDRIFMDVTGIDPGKDFRKVIENAVSSCDVLIAMIGRKWLDAADETGKRRLDDPKDFVRVEAGAALRRDVAVIPVLVQGAAMPRPEQLPAELELLAWRNAFELRHNRWDVDVAELVTTLKKVVPGHAPSATALNTLLWRSLGKRSAAVLIVAAVGIGSWISYIFWLKKEPPNSARQSYGDTVNTGTAPETGSYDVLGSIRTKWEEIRSTPANVGNPVGNEELTFDGVGRFQTFQKGMICWHPETGAHVVWGLIGDRWLQIGREQFGYPITDELATPDGRGRFNHFRTVHLQGKPEASIYWHPDTGAHEVYGAIREKWAAMGFTRSHLGFPVSAEQDAAGGRVQRFQGGALFWNRLGGDVVIQ
jgi:hypothetical protein